MGVSITVSIIDAIVTLVLEWIGLLFSCSCLISIMGISSIHVLHDRIG